MESAESDLADKFSEKLALFRSPIVKVLLCPEFTAWLVWSATCWSRTDITIGRAQQITDVTAFSNDSWCPITVLLAGQANFFLNVKMTASSLLVQSKQEEASKTTFHTKPITGMRISGPSFLSTSALDGHILTWQIWGAEKPGEWKSPSRDSLPSKDSLRCVWKLATSIICCLEQRPRVQSQSLQVQYALLKNPAFEKFFKKPADHAASYGGLRLRAWENSIKIQDISQQYTSFTNNESYRGIRKLYMPTTTLSITVLSAMKHINTCMHLSYVSINLLAWFRGNYRVPLNSYISRLGRVP